LAHTFLGLLKNIIPLFRNKMSDDYDDDDDDDKSVRERKREM
jgi:hypothetical protein